MHVRARSGVPDLNHANAERISRKHHGWVAADRESKATRDPNSSVSD